jgi:hypothetical protein
MHTIIARYYQLAGRIREQLGLFTHNEAAVNVGRHDQLVGRITEFCNVSIEDAEVMASDASGHVRSCFWGFSPIEPRKVRRYIRDVTLITAVSG